MRTSIFAALLCLLFARPALALVTAYASFDQPDGWKCELSQGVWICQSGNEKDRKESVVFSIATVATEWDNLENYETYLKKPRTIQDEDGSVIHSKVTYVRRRNINGFLWVDSLQQDSELPGFWARYLATVQNKLAILITYIVSGDRYQQLAPQFERMVASLKPNSDYNLNVASKQAEGPLPGSTKLGPDLKALAREKLDLGSARKKIAASQPTVTTKRGLLGYLALFLILCVAGWRLWLKRKPKGRKPAPTE